MNKEKCYFLTFYSWEKDKPVPYQVSRDSYHFRSSLSLTNLATELTNNFTTYEQFHTNSLKQHIAKQIEQVEMVEEESTLLNGTKQIDYQTLEVIIKDLRESKRKLLLANTELMVNRTRHIKIVWSQNTSTTYLSKRENNNADYNVKEDYPYCPFDPQLSHGGYIQKIIWKFRYAIDYNYVNYLSKTHFETW